MSGTHLIASLLLLTPVQAEKIDNYILKSHQELSGEVLSIEGDRVTLKVSMFGGTAEVQRDLADFTADSAYRIMASRAGNTFDDHMKLASFAAEVDSLDYLRKELRESFAIAEKAKNEEQQKAVSKFAADCVDKYFAASIAKKDFGMAKKCINILMIKLPNERTAEQKQKMLDAFDAAQEKILSDRKAKQEARAEKASVEETEKSLKPVNTDIAEAKKLANEGLVEGNNNVKAREKFDASIEKLKSAYRKVKTFEKSSNKTLRDQASSLTIQIYDIGKDACLNAASAATFQTDYQGARQYVNLVLSIDPKDKDALEARARIEQASTSGWRW